MTALILALAAFIGDEKQADAALEKFKTDHKAKEASARATAVTELAKVEHVKIIAKLGSLLGVDLPEVRIAAAKGLEEQKGDKKRAVQAIVAGIPPNAKEAGVMVAILKALGKLKDESAAPEVEKHFDHDSTEACKAAIESAGEIRSASSIEPLIKILKQCEEATKKPEAGAGGGRALGKGLPGGRVLRGGSKDEREHAKEIMPDVKKALHSITKTNCQDAKDWEDWWKEHKATFKP